MATTVSTTTELEGIELQETRSRAINDSPTSATRATGEDKDARLRRLGLGEELQDDGLAPQDRGFQAWKFVAASFVLETFIWGFGYSFSPVLVWFQSHEPWSQYPLAALSAIGTIQMALQYLLPIVVVNGFRRYPEYAKPVLLVAAIVFSLAFVVASFATQVWQLILLQGVVCGVCGAILYTPVVQFMNQWFVHRRGVASGIVFAGTGAGGLCFPFLISALLDKYGFAGMCRVWAAVVGAASISSVLAIHPRIPPVKPVKRERWLQLNLEVLRNPLFWVIGSTIFVSSLAYFPVSLYLATYAASALHSPSLFLPSLVVAAFNAAAFVGSTIIGSAADRSLSTTISLLGIGGAVVAFLAWGFSSSLASLLVFAVLYGFGSRISSYFGVGAKEIAGAEANASTTVTVFFGIIRGIASLVGPFLATSLYQEQNANSSAGEWGRFGFRKIIIFVGVMSLVSSIGGLAIYRHDRRRKRALAA